MIDEFAVGRKQRNADPVLVYIRAAAVSAQTAVDSERENLDFISKLGNRINPASGMDQPARRQVLVNEAFLEYINRAQKGYEAHCLQASTTDPQAVKVAVEQQKLRLEALKNLDTALKVVEVQCAPDHLVLPLTTRCRSISLSLTR